MHDQLEKTNIYKSIIYQKSLFLSPLGKAFCMLFMREHAMIETERQ